jgi:hypothetical protein
VEEVKTFSLHLESSIINALDLKNSWEMFLNSVMKIALVEEVRRQALCYAAAISIAKKVPGRQQAGDPAPSF